MALGFMMRLSLPAVGPRYLSARSTFCKALPRGVTEGSGPEPAPCRSRRQDEMTQPPVVLLARLDHSDWTAKKWLPRGMFWGADCGPGPVPQAHLSPFSAPALSSHPIVLLGNASETASAYSCPLTMLMPSNQRLPNELLAFRKLRPQEAPASGG